jgi:hypothetical protein
VVFDRLNEDDQDRYGKVSIFAAIETYILEKVVVNFFKALIKNIIEVIGIVHHNEVLDLLDNPEAIPELKEKCWIGRRLHFTTPENYKLIILYHRYSCIYH